MGKVEGDRIASDSNFLGRVSWFCCLVNGQARWHESSASK